MPGTKPVPVVERTVVVLFPHDMFGIVEANHKEQCAIVTFGKE